MIAASGGVINFTGLAGGYSGERTGQAALMAAPSFESSPWSLCSTASNRSYRSAAVRAAVIALVLLGVLAVIVLL